MKHDLRPFYRGEPTPNRSNHYTGALPLCRVCRQTIVRPDEECPGPPPKPTK